MNDSFLFTSKDIYKEFEEDAGYVMFSGAHTGQIIWGSPAYTITSSTIEAETIKDIDMGLLKQLIEDYKNGKIKVNE